MRAWLVGGWVGGWCLVWRLPRSALCPHSILGPPLSLGRFMFGGVPKVSPHFNYYSTNLYPCRSLWPQNCPFLPAKLPAAGIMQSVPMEVAFASVNMTGHLTPMLPMIRALSDRGHAVTCFFADDAKVKKLVDGLGVDNLRLVPVTMPVISDVSKPGLRAVISAGGPLAALSAPLFDAITRHYYALGSRPAVLVAGFFSTAARDAADALGSPVCTVFPNPLGMTSLLAPHLRGIGGTVHRWLVAAADTLLSSLILLPLRNRERSLRGLQKLTAQDVYPCDAMPRPMLITTAIGYEYPRPMPPLAHFVGPSLPTNQPPLSPRIAAWFDEQTRPVIYVAFGTLHRFHEPACRQLLAILEEQQLVESDPPC